MDLRIPGPTPCPDEVLKALSEQMINHRGKQFAEIIERLTEGVKKVFFTKNDVLLLTTAGTGGMEAAIVNFLSPGDKVLATSVGVFGDRFAEIAETYGADVKRVTKPWGTDFSPKELERELDKNPDVKAVLVTHNETSTGVTNNLEVLAKVVRKFNKLLLVDAISSLSAIPVLTDKWGLDVVVSASQKGWMTPPGIAMISVSPRAWEAYAQAKMPRYHFDLGKAKSFLEKGQTPWTPAVSVFYGLDVAVKMMLSEGMENVFARHKRVAGSLRENLKALGYQLFAKEKCASNTVTAIKVPEGVEASLLIRRLEDKYGIVIAGGQKELSGKIIRIGHLGLVSKDDMTRVIIALTSWAIGEVKI